MKECKQKRSTNPSSKSKFMVKFGFEVERQQSNLQNTNPQNVSSQDSSSKGTAKSHWSIMIFFLLTLIIIMILAIILYRVNPEFCTSVINFFKDLFDFFKNFQSLNIAQTV